MRKAEKLAIDGGVPICPEPIPTSAHGPAEIGEAEKRAVLKVLEKRRVFRFLQEGIDESEAAALEARYAARLGVRHALAVNSGTSALIAGLVGIGLEPGDEVIVPAYTFIATAAAVLAARAIPVICEVDASLTIDPAELRRLISPRTRAIIPVHMRGFPCRMQEILDIAGKHGLLVVEDVAQANGASYKGKFLGTFGKAGCFSFQHFKIITAGEGGLLVTDDDVVFSRARTQHDCASRYWLNTEDEIYDVYGEDYRISELAAALVLAQMDRLDCLLDSFRLRKKRIVAGLADVGGIELAPSADPEGDAGIAVVFYTERPKLSRQFAKALEAEGVPCATIYNKGIPDRHIYCYWPFVRRPIVEGRVCPWTCGCTTTRVRYSPDMCPKTLDYLERAISVHIHQRLTETHCDLIVEAVRKVAHALM